MTEWLAYSLIAVVLWGVVGLLQKLGTNRISSRSLMVWLAVGFGLLLPWFWRSGEILSLRPQELLLGLLGGLTNGLGAWCLFAALEEGAKASVAVPLTSLYPILTIMLATGFLAERLTGWQWAGVFLALLGGAMLSYEG
jgi:transporter family protein